MEPIVVVLWGTEGSGKSSLGLSFPKPLFHMDLDLGGFNRAAWRFDKENHICTLKQDKLLADQNWGDTTILSKPYLVPLQIEKMTGLKKMGTSVRFPRQVVGYKELWQRIVNDFVAACQSPEVQTIMADSATQLWTICHMSLLQEKQEIQITQGIKPEDNKFREKLQAVEFPNDRMRSLIYAAGSFKKNLVLTHYPRNVYKEKFDKNGELVKYKSEDIEPDGFKDTAKLADLILWTYIEKGQPRAKITLKCGVPGLGMSAVGMELGTVAYEGIGELIEALHGVEKEGS